MSRFLLFIGWTIPFLTVYHAAPRHSRDWLKEQRRIGFVGSEAESVNSEACQKAAATILEASFSSQTSSLCPDEFSSMLSHFNYSNAQQDDSTSYRDKLICYLEAAAL